MKLTIAEASKLAGISRQHLYKKYINSGQISITKENDKPFIDTSELIRVFPYISVDTEDDTTLHVLTSKEAVDDSTVNSKNKTIEVLEKQLKEAKEREEWLRSQIDELRKQQNNLLEDKMPQKRRKWLGIF